MQNERNAVRKNNLRIFDLFWTGVFDLEFQRRPWSIDEVTMLSIQRETITYLNEF